ncbi:ABC transporter permease [Roseomonas elaeocarpi]|uniref:ABC transporter permease n=1 Tax=Roseomonas elaeocarpi TaxID=907779 RepID=A0ABV6JWF5_9PROT
MRAAMPRLPLPPVLRAVVTRLLAGIPVFLVVTFAATALSGLMPGSAAQLILGDTATPEQIAALNGRYGYDLPVWERYAHWLNRLLHGDLGETLFSGQSVAGLLFDRAAVTFEIATLAMGVSLLIALPLALHSASHPKGVLDAVLQGVSSLMLSLPTFVTVVILGFVFAVVLRWLPATGWVGLTEDPLNNLRSVALPVMCLSVHQCAYFYRVARAEFTATLAEDYVTVARAKGMPLRHILLRHVLRPSLPPVLTVMGLSMTYLLGGSFIVESYFAVPGIGWTVLSAVSSHDLPVVQAILTLTVAIFVVIFILVDLGYAAVDPRVTMR